MMLKLLAYKSFCLLPIPHLLIAIQGHSPHAGDQTRLPTRFTRRGAGAVCIETIRRGGFGADKLFRGEGRYHICVCVGGVLYALKQYTKRRLRR